MAEGLFDKVKIIQHPFTGAGKWQILCRGGLEYRIGFLQSLFPGLQGFQQIRFPGGKNFYCMRFRQPVRKFLQTQVYVWIGWFRKNAGRPPPAMLNK